MACVVATDDSIEDHSRTILAIMGWDPDEPLGADRLATLEGLYERFSAEMDDLRDRATPVTDVAGGRREDPYIAAAQKLLGATPGESSTSAGADVELAPANP